MSTKRKTYNADEVTVTFGGDLIEGFADGSMITIERNNPLLVRVAGTTGEQAYSRHADRSATVTIKLLQTSESNDVFADAAALNERGPGLPGFKPLFIRDRNGRALYEGEAAPEELPSSEFDRSATAREWKLTSPDLSQDVKGSPAL